MHGCLTATLVLHAFSISIHLKCYSQVATPLSGTQTIKICQYMAATARCACQQLSITPQTTHPTLTNTCIVYPLELGPDGTHVLHSIQCPLEFLAPKDSATACLAAQWAVSGIHWMPATLPDCQPRPTTTPLPPHQHHHHQAGGAPPRVPAIAPRRFPAPTFHAPGPGAAPAPSARLVTQPA